MTKLPLAGALILASLLTGCDDPVPPASRTPHGGSLVALAGGKGFVEVLKQADPAKDGLFQVAVYFLDADRKVMGSSPTAARLKPEGKSSKPIDLAAGPDGSLVTPSMPDLGEFSGMLTATIEGKELSVPIAIR